MARGSENREPGIFSSFDGCAVGVVVAVFFGILFAAYQSHGVVSFFPGESTKNVLPRPLLKLVVQSEDIFEDVFHSSELFRRNYEQMEKNFKIFIYPEIDDNGDFCNPPEYLENACTSEYYFFKIIRSSSFRTQDPDRAHLFFIPISSCQIRYQTNSLKTAAVIFQNYVEKLMRKYPYWNRTLGADHFIITCFSNGLDATEGVPLLLKNSIRLACTSSYGRRFISHKDVSLPTMKKQGCPPGGESIKRRKILDYWPVLSRNEVIDILQQNLQDDTRLDNIPTGKMQINASSSICDKNYCKAKFCIYPSGPGANTSRIFESIYYGCVPVVMANYFKLPYSDILDWQKFSLVLNNSRQLKSLLRAKEVEDYARLYSNLIKAQKHFDWNTPPVRYDAFHMVMYELWLLRHVIRY